MNPCKKCNQHHAELEGNKRKVCDQCKKERKREYTQNPAFKERMKGYQKDYQQKYMTKLSHKLDKRERQRQYYYRHRDEPEFKAKHQSSRSKKHQHNGLAESEIIRIMEES